MEDQLPARRRAGPDLDRAERHHQDLLGGRRCLPAATLVASIYGMNFDGMPELHWTYGYPFALGLMVLSAILPFLYFKRKGWL